MHAIREETLSTRSPRLVPAAQQKPWPPKPKAGATGQGSRVMGGRYHCAIAEKIHVEYKHLVRCVVGFWIRPEAIVHAGVSRLELERRGSPGWAEASAKPHVISR